MSASSNGLQPDHPKVEDRALQGGQRLRGIVAKGSTEFPLVTVVTAVFNGEPYLAACLDSVLRQEYPNIEHVVMDGASRDRTLDVLHQYDDRIAFWNSEPDKGAYDAWNKGLLAAQGEWICFLGVDDEFEPGSISAYMNLARENPDAEYLTSRAEWIHPSGYKRIIGQPWRWGLFRKRMSTSHVGSMHHRSLYDRLGNYDISYRSAADYEFLLRAGRELKTAYMPMITVKMRAGGVSDDPNAFAEATRAKIATGARSIMMANLELFIADMKFKFRPLRRRVATLFQ